MRFMRLFNGRAARVAAGFVALAIGSAASAASVQYQLQDHPDGNATPPGYGMRLDNLLSGLGGSGGTTTFSFNVFNDVVLTVVDNGGGDLDINIAGTVYGGEDTGSGYGFGEGAYDLEFTFRANVAPEGTGWVVDAADPTNNGTLTAQAGIAGIAAGTTFDIYDNSARSFLFLQDEHRLGGEAEAGQGFWVGRGWLTTNSDNSASGGTRDFLFLGSKLPGDTVVPLPGAGAMGLAGLALIGARRRR